MSAPDWLADTAKAVGPYIPPAIGALIGLRYAQHQTPLQKATSWATGCTAGIVFAPWAAELLELTTRGTVAVGFLIGFVGYDLMLGTTAIARQFGANPFGTVKDILVAWWTRGKP